MSLLMRPIRDWKSPKRLGRLAWLLGLAFSAACHSRTLDSHVETATAVVCTLGQERVQDLLVGDWPTYVEPDGIAADGASILLVGAPVVRWGGATLGTAAADRPEALGVLLEGNGTATLVPSPVPATTVEDVRVVALGSHEWAVAFAMGPEPHGGERQIDAYWFGVTDGKRWLRSAVWPVRAGVVRSLSASALVRTPIGVALAVPVADSGRWDVLVLELAKQGVRAERIHAGGAAYVALAAVQDRLLLAVVQADRGEVRDVNSLFVQSRPLAGGTWTVPARSIRGGDVAVRSPAITPVAGGALLSWRASTPNGMTARYAYLSGSEVSAVTQIADSKVEQLLPLPGAAVPMLLVTQEASHPSATPGELFAIQPDGAHAVGSLRMAAEPVRAVIAGSEFVAVGAALGDGRGAPSLQSRLTRHPMLCDAR